MSDNKVQKNELLSRYQTTFVDDGLKKLSASEYLQVPLAHYVYAHETRARAHTHAHMRR